MRSLCRIAFAALVVVYVVVGPFDSTRLRAEEDDVARAIAKFRERVAKAEGVSFVGRLRERSGGKAIQLLGSTELTIIGVAGIRAEGKRLEVRDFRIDVVGEAGRRLAFYDGEKVHVADFAEQVVRSGDADWETLLGPDFGDLLLAVAGLPRDDRMLQVERAGMRTIGVARMLRFDAWLETPEQTEERTRKRPFVFRPRQTDGEAGADGVADAASYPGPTKILTIGLDPDTGDLYRLDLRESMGPTTEGKESVRIVTLSFDPFRLLAQAPEDRLEFPVPERFPRESVDWSNWSWEQAIQESESASGANEPAEGSQEHAP